MRQFPDNQAGSTRYRLNPFLEWVMSDYRKVSACLFSLFIFALFFFLFDIPPVKANSFVIVTSEGGAGLRQGDLLLAGSQLDLPVDAKLTLLTAKGEKILITGPLRGSLKEALPPENHAMLEELSAKEQEMIEEMVDILSEHRQNSMPVRGVSKAPEPEDTWQINTVVDGDQCSMRGHRPFLWRPNIDNRESMSISAQALGDETSVIFGQGAGVHPWPIDLSLVDKGIYELKTDTRNDAKTIVLHLIPDNLPTRAHLASVLSKNKCSRQAAQLLIEAEIDKLLGQLITKGKF